MKERKNKWVNEWMIWNNLTFHHLKICLDIRGDYNGPSSASCFHGDTVLSTQTCPLTLTPDGSAPSTQTWRARGSLIPTQASISCQPQSNVIRHIGFITNASSRILSFNYTYNPFYVLGQAFILTADWRDSYSSSPSHPQVLPQFLVQSLRCCIMKE